VVITFHPHPRNIVGDTSGIKLLNTLTEKINLLQQQGIHHLVVVPFNDEFANLSAEDYITQFSIQKNLSQGFLIIGYDHRFGKR
jgi:riboflavin kinase/FMN adenylyltransferase